MSEGTSYRVHDLEVPPRDLAIAPAPLRPSGGGSFAALAALSAIVAVIVVGIAAATVVPPDAPLPSAPAVSPSAAAASAPSAAASSREAAVATRAPGADSPRISAPHLVQAVSDGTLEGRLVFIDGDLSTSPAPCAASQRWKGGCVTLAVKGLGLPVRPGPEEVPWRGDPAPGSWLVTVVRGDGLVYLGSLVPTPDGAVPIDVLTRRLLAKALDEPPRTVFEVSGWLVVNAVHSCVTRDPAATPCPAPAPFVAEDEPLADGALRSPRGGTVDLAAPLIDVDANAVVTHGTFLVQLPQHGRCDPSVRSTACPEAGVRWLVVARYEPARAVRVLVP